MKPNIAALQAAPDVTLYHSGPALDHGPLPSFFYFALSGPDSLTLDPFNQPVQFLQGKMIRVFSMTLPGHEANLPATGALSIWANDFEKGIDPIGQFLDSASIALDFAIREKFVDPSRIAVGGLSRGGLIAAHFAARAEKIKFLLGFAPVTKLRYVKEFSHIKEHPLVTSYNLENLSESLAERHTRLYIGNCDTLVRTHSCFDFAMSLVAKAEEKKIRSPQVELFITPSIGRMGHGTPPEIFQQGADWVFKVLSK